MKQMWNDKFKAEQYLYGETPNIVFKSFIDKLEPGKILLPGEGEGRHAVYAALKGWDVTAVDYSEQGRQKALALADKNGVKINYLTHDIINYIPPENYFDVVANIFVHLPSVLRKEVYHNQISGLKQNGILFITAFSTYQYTLSSGGPKDKDLLFTTKGLANEVSNVEILRNEEMIVRLAEGTGHIGLAEMIAFEGRKQ